MPIYERSVASRGILSDLFWIYALVIAFPEERRGWRLRADVGLNRFPSHCISAALGKFSLNYSLLGKLLFFLVPLPAHDFVFHSLPILSTSVDKFNDNEFCCLNQLFTSFSFLFFFFFYEAHQIVSCVITLPLVFRTIS